MSKYGVFYGPNTGKYEPENTPYLDTFFQSGTYTISLYYFKCFYGIKLELHDNFPLLLVLLQMLKATKQKGEGVKKLKSKCR